MSVNRFQCTGNLGADPEVFTFDNGDKQVSFSVGVNESYKNDKGEKIEKTVWVNFVSYKGFAEVIEKYLKKGSKVYVEGKMRVKDYEKDGVKRYITEFIVSFLEMLDSKKNSAPSDNVPY